MERSAFIDKVAEQAKHKKDWIHPQWEPFAACTPEEQVMLAAMLDMLATAADHIKSLGAMALVFEKTDPERQFQMYDPELGQDAEFYTKRIKNTNAVENVISWMKAASAGDTADSPVLVRASDVLKMLTESK